MGGVDSSLFFLKKSVTATMTHTSHPHFTTTLPPRPHPPPPPREVQSRLALPSTGECQPRTEPWVIFRFPVATFLRLK